MSFDKTHVRPSDLPDTFRADQADHQFVFRGIDLADVFRDLGDDLYGVLVDPEDLPSVTLAIPDPINAENPPALLSHTSAFPSKLDARDITTGRVVTQINYGSIPPEASILDLRPDKPTSLWS